MGSEKRGRRFPFSASLGTRVFLSIFVTGVVNLFVIGAVYYVSLVYSYGVLDPFDLWELAAVSFFLVCVYFVASYFSSSYVTDSLKKLKDGVERVTRGDLDHKIKVEKEDEFGKLASSFNWMTEELKKTRKELEDKVRERTRELEMSRDELSGKVRELERFEKFAVGRELRMKELKEKVTSMEGGTGKKGREAPHRRK